jgi:6-phosphogluconolactonase
MLSSHKYAFNKTAVYASVGRNLMQYGLDIEKAELVYQGSVSLPENIQYAWPHASGRYLYVASSDATSGMGPRGNRHWVSTFKIDQSSGVLSQHGDAIMLPGRPIHISTDIPSRNLFVAFSNPGALKVYGIDSGGYIIGEVKQNEAFEFDNYPHHVRITPDNRFVILVCRGHDPKESEPEEPGALRIFEFENGKLKGFASIAPNGGFGFGPRDIEFHPAKPWAYVSLERQNRLEMFRIAGNIVPKAAIFSKITLGESRNVAIRQIAGALHIHPNGRFVYCVNRAFGTEDFEERKVFSGGENTFAVYALNTKNGEPDIIQHIDTNGIYCRTFQIDPSGRILIAANMMPMLVKKRESVDFISANLSVFYIAANGTLKFVRKYDVDVGSQKIFWMGMVTLPEIKSGV